MDDRTIAALRQRGLAEDGGRVLTEAMLRVVLGGINPQPLPPCRHQPSEA